MDAKHQMFEQEGASDPAGSLYLESLTPARVAATAITTSSGATIISSGNTTVATSSIIPTDESVHGTPLTLEAASAAAVSAMKSGPTAMLDSQLSALYFAQSDSAVAMSAYTSTVQQFANSFTTDGHYVLVDTTARNGDGAALLSELQSLGLKGGSSFGAVASGWLPVANVHELTTTANLQFARESAYTTNTGSVTTQADAGEAADTARSTYGVTGTGIRVGVLSDSFDAYAINGEADTAESNVATDDLPANYRILEDNASGEDEGRGMAQLIHDLAPGAGIDFATAYSGQAGFANNILALAAAGDRIIVDDVSYYAELDYQNGVIGQAVNQVAAAGVSYFSSAGNDGVQGYEGAWAAGSTATLLGQNYTLMNFAPGQDYLNITNSSGSVLELQWDSPGASAGGTGSSNDLDFFLVDLNGNVVAASTANNLGGDPVELMSGVGTGTYRIYVGLASGSPPPGEIRIIASGNGRAVALQQVASNVNASTLAGHHGADGAMATGAAAFYNVPAAGVTPPVAESFTSGGTMKILYDDDGNRLGSADINGVAFTAVDGGNTTFFVSDSSHDPDSFPNFFGTSAAAPDAAAVAALLLNANGTLTPEDIRGLLSDSAIDINAAGTSTLATGFDTRTGAGLIQADAAVRYVTTHVIANDAQATLYGTHLSETISGSALDNTIFANQGDDIVKAGAGADTVHGGDGADQLYGNQGDDLLYGDAGNDTIYGGQGNDIVYGGAGDDTIIGGLGNDVLNGGTGNNTVSYASASSGESIDLDLGGAVGGDGTDSLYNIQNAIGSGFADYLGGNGEANILSGGAGSDELHGGDGNDTLDGGFGNETEYADTVSRPDLTKSGTTLNTSIASALAFNVGTGGDFDTNPNPDIGAAQTIPHATVNATASGSGDEYYAVTVDAGATATFDIDNNVEGSGPLDTVINLVDAAGNILESNDDSYSDPGSNSYASALTYTFDTAGTYYLEVTEYNEPAITAGDTYTLNVSLTSADVTTTGTFTSGFDTIDGGNGIDTATYASATSAVHVDLTLQGEVQDTLGGGPDKLTSIENLTGSGFNDTLIGDAGDNTIKGGDGLDTIRGGDGNDTIYGNAGNDTLSGNAGDDLVNGGQGNDTIYGGGGNDTLVGGIGNDTIYGGVGADTLTGGAGVDTFKFTSVNDSPTSAPDTITDFVTGTDRIDLNTLPASAGDRATISTQGGNSTVSVDLGGNGSVDLLIRVNGLVTAGDIQFRGTVSSGASGSTATAGETAHADSALAHDASFASHLAMVQHDHGLLV